MNCRAQREESSPVHYFAGHRIKGALAYVAFVFSFQIPLLFSSKKIQYKIEQSACSLKKDSLGTVLNISSFLQKPVHITSTFYHMADVLVGEAVLILCQS